MAALSLQNSEDVPGFSTAFTGSHRYIIDYLIEEVLNRQSPAIQSFLLLTSILDRMAGSLYDALTGQADGQTRLHTCGDDPLTTRKILCIPVQTYHKPNFKTGSKVKRSARFSGRSLSFCRSAREFVTRTSIFVQKILRYALGA